MKYILAYKLPGDSFVQVECLSEEETLIRLCEMFGEFESLDDVFDALDYGEIDISSWEDCEAFTIATTLNEILFTT